MSGPAAPSRTIGCLRLIDRSHELVARPVRRGEDNTAPFGNGVVEEADCIIELDLVQDGCRRDSVMEGR